MLVALTGACARAPAPTGYLPAAPAIVDVVEQDYGYALGGGADIPPGRAVFRVANRSRLAHDLSLVALPDDVPPIIDQLRSSDRRVVATLARLPSRPPGSNDAFAVDLAPGRYALLCFQKEGTEEPHAFKGMVVEFRVGSPPGRPT